MDRAPRIVNAAGALGALGVRGTLGALGVLIVLIVLIGLGACGPSTSGGSTPVSRDELHRQIVADFEKGVLGGEEAYARLFDFSAVGKFEKLLHRYDLRGRSELTPEQKEQFAKEDATPFSVERERRNLGHNFFPMLAVRTVGTGGCKETTVIDPYAQALGRPFEPLTPEDASYDSLRLGVNTLIEHGGIIGIACSGGKGQLAVVYTRTESSRGYDLITLYDDVGGDADQGR
jgi:hypothetical protein